MKMVRVNSQRNQNSVVPTVCDLPKKDIYWIIYHIFGPVVYYPSKTNSKNII